MTFLSRVLNAVGVLVPGDEGGNYWISVGVRFGPQTDAERGDLAEMYKRYRGMFLRGGVVLARPREEGRHHEHDRRVRDRSSNR